MRILHVLDHSIPLHSGYTFRSYQILKGQRDLGYETVHVTGIKQGPCANAVEEVDGLEFHRTINKNALLEKIPVFGQYEVVRSLTKRIREIVSSQKIDVIHAHSPVLNAMAALKVGKEFDIPVVYEIRAFWEDASVSHGTSREGDLRYRITQSLETKAVKKADAVTVICQGLKNDLMERGIADDKITLIPNAVDLTKFSGPQDADPELQERLGLKGKVTLGFIGSFYDYEGLDILLQSMPYLTNEVPEARLLLVGGGQEEANLKAQVDQQNLKNHVIFTGRVPHDKVQNFYNLVDIFVYPRKKMRLTDLVTPLKPLEAMAQHKLVSASDIGGHNELIEDGKTGVLFKPDDPIALAKKIASLVHQQEKWPDMIAAGREYVENVRNWPNSIANYPAVYDRIVKK